MGYYRAGFDVVGVDINLQKNYPFEFHHADALTYPLEGFDAIHASPPCQRFSTMYNLNRDRHPDFIDPIRRRLQAVGEVWVIENTPQAPLVDPITLCGSMFGLGVRRHRIFESSVPMTAPVCDHASQPKKYWIYDHGRWYLSSVVAVYGHGGGTSRHDAPEAMGIDWMTHSELVESIPPAYTEWIGRSLAPVSETQIAA